jgi:predicted double-glycine peptidase
MELLRYNYKQKNDWTCGPAVARVLLYYYDNRMDIQEVVKGLKTTRSGTTNASLMRFLKKNAVKFRVKKQAALEDIRKYLKKNWVVVAYWIPSHKESHYSIVKKITAKRIYFHDTWFGSNHSYDAGYFFKNWWDQEATRWLLAVRK